MSLFQISYRPRVSSAVELTQRSGFRSDPVRNQEEVVWTRSEVMQLIGERVRKYRRQKGWSQEQLGAMVHFSQSKISKIERDDWDSLTDLRLIAKALEVPIEELVREDEHSDER